MVPVSAPRLARLALAALVLAGPAALPRPALAVDDVHFNPATGHYYKRVAASMTWAQARVDAEAQGGYLCSITSAAELTWVLATVGTGGGDVWLGGTDAAQEGVWVWVNGDPWAYANWNTGEPNNVGGEHWVEMYSNGTWNDVPASHANPGYILEWDTNPNAPPPPVPPAAPSGLTASLQFNGTIALQWIDNASNESEFEVERMGGGDPWARIARPGIDATSLTDLDLRSSTDYTYRVRAKNSAGLSAWSNEASATSGTFIPLPRAPSDLVVTATSPTTLSLQWTDNSDGETGFEVRRSSGGGPFAFRGMTAASATTYQDQGLAPDASYAYQVRAVGTVQASSAVEVAGRTDPTLAVASVRGDLRDSAKFGKDSLKLTTSWSALPESPDGATDPLAEGITLRVGRGGGLLTFAVAAGDPSWKGKATRWSWKSPKDQSTKVKVKLDTATGLLSLAVKKVEIPAAPGNEIRVSVVIGNDAGTESREWPEAKPGLLQLR